MQGVDTGSDQNAEVMNWAQRVRSRLTQTQVQESLRIAARDVVVEMGERIFERGEDANGDRIGEYSTRPISIAVANMPRRVSGTRSSGGSVFFAGGYDQFKKELGYDRVNWRVFGVLMRDFVTPKETIEGNSIKLGLKNEENSEKLDKLKRQYGENVVQLSASERETMTKVFNFELQKRIFEDGFG